MDTFGQYAPISKLGFINVIVLLIYLRCKKTNSDEQLQQNRLVKRRDFCTLLAKDVHLFLARPKILCPKIICSRQIAAEVFFTFQKFLFSKFAICV